MSKPTSSRFEKRIEKRKLPKTDDEYQDVFVGYTVSKTVVVKLRDIKKFEEFFSEAVRSGVSHIGSVVYSTSQLRKYKDEARTMAMRAAREKATALTREMRRRSERQYRSKRKMSTDFEVRLQMHRATAFPSRTTIPMRLRLFQLERSR